MKLIRKIKYPLTIVLFIFAIIYVISTKRNLEKNKYNDIEVVTNDMQDEQPKEMTEEITNYTIDIKGAIKNPGVYTIDSNSNVNDVSWWIN